MPLTWTLKQWLINNRGLQLPPNQAHTNAAMVQSMVQHRTGSKLQLRAVHALLEKQPQTLDCRTLQAICDTFQCRLSDFCALTPSPNSSAAHVDLDLQRLLEPCAIRSDETLYSFTSRVQIAAIEKALSICGNYTRAARRLGYHRTSLHHLHAQLRGVPKTPNRNAPGYHTPPPSFPDALRLPDRSFTIRANEYLRPFLDRLQLAAIIEATRLEGNHTRAALRLRCNRGSLVTLFYRLQARCKTDLTELQVQV